MSLASTADLTDWLEIGALDASRAQLVLDVATGQIQSYTRQTLEEVAADAIELQGTWEHVIELPERPVSSVTSVTVDGEAQVEGDDYVVVRNELRRPNAEFHNWMMPSDDFYPFAKTGWGGPSVLVEVTYTHGFSTIPDDLRGVCLALAGRIYMNPEAAAMKVIDAQTFQYGLRYLDLTAGEQALLDKYRRRVRSMSQW